jgi:hypothetical protein
MAITQSKRERGTLHSELESNPINRALGKDTCRNNNDGRFTQATHLLNEIAPHQAPVQKVKAKRTIWSLDIHLTEEVDQWLNNTHPNNASSKSMNKGKFVKFNGIPHSMFRGVCPRRPTQENKAWH